MKERDILASIVDAGGALTLLVVALLAHIWLFIPVAAAWALVGLRQFSLARRARDEPPR